MKARFNNLFSVSFLHDYFAATVFDGLQAKPDHETSDTILKNGFIFKPFISGFSILYDSFSSGSQRLLEDVLSNPVTLSFAVTLTDQHFYNYTVDFGADISAFNFLFTNSPGINCPAEKGENLHRDKYVTSKELTMAESHDAALFGKIIITIDNNLKQDYYIRFEQKSTHLRYFLVSNYLLALDQPAIIDSSNQQKFSDAAPVTLSNGKSAIVFISEKEIRFSHKSKSAFNLVENYEKETGKYKLVKSGLPLPDVRAVSKALDGNEYAGKFYSDIFL
jgi:hypothetical protein